MNVVKEIQRLNDREANLSTSASGSWHEQYKDSAHVFVGGLPYNLTEGDIICVLSQFGEIAGINLVRDKESGKSKGFAFLKYVDQRSTILAVDNMNGSKIGGRVIRVDHVQNYKVPKVFDADGNELEPDEDMVNNAAPKLIEDEDSDDDASSESEVDDTGIDIDDPMREYLLKKKRKKDAKKSKRKSEKEGGESKAERRARRELKKAAKKEKKDKGDPKVDDGKTILGLNRAQVSEKKTKGNNDKLELDPVSPDQDKVEDVKNHDEGPSSTTTTAAEPTPSSSVATAGTAAEERTSSSRRSRSRSPASYRYNSYRDQDYDDWDRRRRRSRSRSPSRSPDRNRSSSSYHGRSRRDLGRDRSDYSSRSRRDSIERRRDDSRDRKRDDSRERERDRDRDRRHRS